MRGTSVIHPLWRYARQGGLRAYRSRGHHPLVATHPFGHLVERGEKVGIGELAAVDPITLEDFAGPARMTHFIDGIAF